MIISIAFKLSVACLLGIMQQTNKLHCISHLKQHASDVFTICFKHELWNVLAYAKLKKICNIFMTSVHVCEMNVNAL